MVYSQLSIWYGMLTDAGVQRSDQPNQDTVYAFQEMSQTSQQFSLFVVADGMGGHANGEEASLLAVNTLADFLHQQISSGDVVDEEYGKALLKAAVKRANDAVCQRNQEAFEDSGTTMTAVLIVDAVAYIANVGDSRTYLWRWSERLRQITIDHSLVARLVASNMLAPEDIYTHPRRNQIYRCLGEKRALEVDVFVEPLQIGDRILLCSDGLWEMVRDPEINMILFASPSPDVASQQLLDKAIANGGEDNVSVIVAQMFLPENHVAENCMQATVEDTTHEPMLLLQLVHVGDYVLMPLAACLHAWCVMCSFLILTILPWLCSLPSKALSLVQEVVDLDDRAPVPFHLVAGSARDRADDMEIDYHDLVEHPLAAMQAGREEPIGYEWEWALY